MSERENIRTALAYIPAYDRELWVRIGHALKGDLGEDGFDLWGEWSERDESYNSKDAHAVWKSIKPNGRVRIDTLFYEARRNGYTGESRTPHDNIDRQRDRVTDEAKQARQHAMSASKAAAIWKAATEAKGDHPYLVRKDIRTVSTLREIPVTKAAAILGYAPKSKSEPLSGRLIVVPVKVNDRLSTLELIDELGKKAALFGGAKGGGYWAAQPLPEGNGQGVTLMIGEGVATALSAKEATGFIAIAALTCGNLQRVAKELRERYPAATMILLADVGKGQSKAEQAAHAVDGLLAIPDFGDNRPEGASDFNDLAQQRGRGAVSDCIANAKTPAKNAQSGDGEGRIAYCKASEIQAKPIRWLWKGRIARGKVSMLAGNPGLGKSQITASLAAIVSTGGVWPVDRTQCERGNVVILSAEDDPADTIRPRLEAAGADLERVIILDGIIRHTDGSGRALSLKSDMDRLDDTLIAIGDVALVVIDPITAYLGDVDSHKNAEIRGSLAPLSDLAAEHATAVLCVSHLNKSGGSDAMLRVTGSLAFVAAARAAFLVAKDKENEARRLFLPMKNNIGNDRTGLAFEVQSAQMKSSAGLIDTSRVMWEAEAVTVTADEAMISRGDPDERGALEDAKTFLREVLKDGAIASKQVRAEAAEAGYSWRTIRRAKDELQITPTKTRFDGGWEWSLTAKVSKNPEDVQQNNVDPFGKVGHLRSVRAWTEPTFEVIPDDDAEVFEVEV